MMLRKIQICSLFIALQACAYAQDIYHTSMVSGLTNTYQLPATPSWVLPNTEAATLAITYDYGGTTTDFAPTGQPFSQARRRTVTASTNPWDAGHGYPNQATITTGDRCLLVMWMRSPIAGATINLYAENSTDYFKEAFSQIRLSDTWERFLVPFEAQNTYAVGGLNFGLHLAYTDQTVEIGGTACLNYKNTVNLTDLPAFLGNGFYDGMAPDAPWRAQALADIEQLRKANMQINVVDANGQPINNATVSIDMQQHAFKFGSAVVSNLFNGGSAFNATYQQKMLNLDGKGHGFNEIVFENDLKWPAWEQGWFSTRSELVSDIAWLQQRGISVRGHNLVWPNWGYSPTDINETQTPNYIKNRINMHLESILTYQGVGKSCTDWDVLNEITTSEEYANHFAGTPGYTTGRELYPDIFKRTKDLAPDVKRYINDFVAIEQGDLSTTRIPIWRARIDEMLAAGAPIDGIGFQGHFSESPTGIPRVQSILDEFWMAYGKEAKITEYDISKFVSDTLQAMYMRDILTASFAHPSMKGFLMWGFWDGAHWQDNAPLFRQDWSLKLSGQAFIDQVFNQWWTNDTLATTLNGIAQTRAYKGKYLVKVTCPDVSAPIETRTFDLVNDTTLTVQLPCLVADKEATKDQLSLIVWPNPIPENGRITVAFTLQNAEIVQIDFLDEQGKLIQNLLAEKRTSGSHSIQIDLPKHLPKGVYVFSIQSGGAMVSKKVVVQ
jgi:endo-1,4-beta-xylanase